MPLGTGNDLARALNWGEGYVGDVELEDILHEIEVAKPIKLDRYLEIKRTINFSYSIYLESLLFYLL